MREECEVCGAPATRGTLCIACEEGWGEEHRELTDDEEAAEELTWD